MGDFRKKYPTDWLSGKTNSCKEIPEEKNSYTDKISFKACKAGKKFYHQRFGGKIFFTQTKSSVPLSKVKWSAPKVLGMFSYDQLIISGNSLLAQFLRSLI